MANNPVSHALRAFKLARIFRHALAGASLIMLAVSAAQASAEPYNLVCSSSGKPMATLTVRDNWIVYLTPEIRVLTGPPGETAPVNVEAYTADKIKVGISIDFEKFPNEKSELTISIDRNTGAAEYVFSGPWHTTKTGVRYREDGETEQGQCERQKPAL